MTKFNTDTEKRPADALAFIEKNPGIKIAKVARKFVVTNWVGRLPRTLDFWPTSPGQG
jgi:hypothetical protein